MKNFSLVGRITDRLSPWNCVMHAQFDSEVVTQLLESIGIICKSVSVNVASIGTGASGVGTVAVTGLTPQHRCFVSMNGAASAAIAIVGARCATAGTLTVDA